MAGERKRCLWWEFGNEFKVGVVALVRAHPKQAIASVAWDLGIHETILGHYR